MDEHKADNSQEELDKKYPPIEEDRELPKWVRPLVIFIAVSMLGIGVVLQQQRIRRIFKEEPPEPPSGRGVDAQDAPTYVAPPPEVYAWKQQYDPAQSLVARIPPPPGFRRVPVAPESFAHWLGFLPLKPGDATVLLHTGEPAPNQGRHFAVIDIDTGQKDLQQCADAIIRLRAEYLYGTGQWDRIVFRFTSGDEASWSKWLEGYRPVVGDDNKVTWKKSAGRDVSRENFLAYLETVFIYAGTKSLDEQLKRVDASDMRIGDVFCHPVSPGHAAVVVDMAYEPQTSRRVFLLAQGFMPAQDMHILINPADPNRGPWYPVEFGPALQTPGFTFQAHELGRWKDR